MARLSRIAGWTGGALLAAGVALVGYQGYAVMRAQARTPAALASVQAREVRLADVPRARIDALLAVEDPGFWTHRGVDVRSPGQGQTTITQGLVKRLYFRRFRPGFAKIEQSLIARFVLHPAMSKTDQLEAFLNYAYMGQAGGGEVIGFPAAARVYYGKPLDQLSEHEFLTLVAMPMAPNALDPKRRPAANARRTARIERLLAGRCRPGSLLDVTYPACA
jgi:membrane peptidoglycan carboxypeptidase